MGRNYPALAGALAIIGMAAATSGCSNGTSTTSQLYQKATFTEYPVPGTGNVPGASPGGVWPDDVAGDTAGDIWCPEHHGDNIVRISPTGVYTGFPVLTPNGLMDGITIDNTRNVLYVTETANNKIARLDMTTGVVTEITMPQPNSVPGDLVHSADGTVWLTEGYEGGVGATRIARMDPTTLQITEFTPTTPRNGADDLVLTPQGDLWFVEYADNRICKLSNGQFTEVMLPRPNVVPTNISIDTSGNLWVSEQAGNAIAEYNPISHIWREVPILTANGQPSGVCIDSSNNVWFTEYNSSIIGVIPAGTFKVIEYTIPTPNSGPEDIEVAPNGNIIFTEQYGAKVGIIHVQGLTP
jgi:virginiamycin B lyase